MCNDFLDDEDYQVETLFVYMKIMVNLNNLKNVEIQFHDNIELYRGSVKLGITNHHMLRIINSEPI